MKAGFGSARGLECLIALKISKKLISKNWCQKLFFSVHDCMKDFYISSNVFFFQFWMKLCHSKWNHVWLFYTMDHIGVKNILNSDIKSYVLLTKKNFFWSKFPLFLTLIPSLIHKDSEKVWYVGSKIMITWENPPKQISKKILAYSNEYAIISI